MDTPNTMPGQSSNRHSRHNGRLPKIRRDCSDSLSYTSAKMLRNKHSKKTLKWVRPSDALVPNHASAPHNAFDAHTAAVNTARQERRARIIYGMWQLIASGKVGGPKPIPKSNKAAPKAKNYSPAPANPFHRKATAATMAHYRQRKAAPKAKNYSPAPVKAFRRKATTTDVAHYRKHGIRLAELARPPARRKMSDPEPTPQPAEGTICSAYPVCKNDPEPLPQEEEALICPSWPACKGVSAYGAKNRWRSLIAASRAAAAAYRLEHPELFEFESESESEEDDEPLLTPTALRPSIFGRLKSKMPSWKFWKKKDDKGKAKQKEPKTKSYAMRVSTWGAAILAKSSRMASFTTMIKKMPSKLMGKQKEIDADRAPNFPAIRYATSGPYGHYGKDESKLRTSSWASLTQKFGKGKAKEFKFKSHALRASSFPAVASANSGPHGAYGKDEMKLRTGSWSPLAKKVGKWKGKEKELQFHALRASTSPVASSSSSLYDTDELSLRKGLRASLKGAFSKRPGHNRARSFSTFTVIHNPSSSMKYTPVIPSGLRNVTTINSISSSDSDDSILSADSNDTMLTRKGSIAARKLAGTFLLNMEEQKMGEKLAKDEKRSTEKAKRISQQMTSQRTQNYTQAANIHFRNAIDESPEELRARRAREAEEAEESQRLNKIMDTVREGEEAKKLIPLHNAKAAERKRKQKLDEKERLRREKLEHKRASKEAPKVQMRMSAEKTHLNASPVEKFGPLAARIACRAPSDQPRIPLSASMRDLIWEFLTMDTEENTEENGKENMAENTENTDDNIDAAPTAPRPDWKSIKSMFSSDNVDAASTRPQQDDKPIRSFSSWDNDPDLSSPSAHSERTPRQSDFNKESTDISKRRQTSESNSSSIFIEEHSLPINLESSATSPPTRNSRQTTSASATSFNMPEDLASSAILPSPSHNLRSTTPAIVTTSTMPPPTPPTPQIPGLNSVDPATTSHPSSAASSSKKLTSHELETMLKSHLPPKFAIPASQKARDLQEFLRANPGARREDFVHPSELVECKDASGYREEVYKEFLPEYPRLQLQQEEIFNDLDVSINAIKRGLNDPEAWKRDVRAYIAGRYTGADDAVGGSTSAATARKDLTPTVQDDARMDAVKVSTSASIVHNDLTHTIKREVKDDVVDEGRPKAPSFRYTGRFKAPPPPMPTYTPPPNPMVARALARVTFHLQDKERDTEEDAVVEKEIDEKVDKVATKKSDEDANGKGKAVDVEDEVEAK